MATKKTTKQEKVYKSRVQEAYDKEVVPALTEKLKAAKMERLTALRRLGLSEEDFVPVYSCKKCSDTGFLPNGRICNCYREN